MSRKRNKRGNRKRNKVYRPVVAQQNTPASTSTAPSPTGRSMSVTQSMTFFSGPLPPAEVLHQYELLLPGSADRIMKMAEGQSEHRQGLEKRTLSSDIIRSYMGIACALIIAVYGIYTAGDMVKSGHQVTGALFGFGALATLVGAFLKATSDRKEIIANARRLERSPQNGQSK